MITCNIPHRFKLPAFIWSLDTHDAILNTEAELKLKVRSLDEDSGDRRAAHNTQLYFDLILQTLEQIQKNVIL